MDRNRISQSPPSDTRFGVVGIVLAGLLLTSPLLAQIVSANPHEASLRSGSTPALSGIAQLSNVDVNAYHVSTDTEVNRALAYSHYNRPKILSDDGGGSSLANVQKWIPQTCSAGEHFEHYDGKLTNAALGGTYIDSIFDFPQESRDVLRFIRDNSCVSDLAPWGTLTRSGREFYWNGQKVNLIGHSWMGALAGKNFDIPKYLDVLEDHRVNLTRVWVIEQWTGFLAGKIGNPHPSNAVLPFAGSMDFSGSNDSLDLYQINSQFLQRLRAFVDAAAARGIVVQLTLFDRHGLLNKAAPDDKGRWIWSPYNVNNNWNDQATAGSTGKAPAAFVTSACTGNVLMSKTYPPRFTGDEACVLRIYNEKLVKSIVQELSTSNNVIYEIMNEPLAGEWGETPLTDWHAWVANIVKTYG